MPKNRFEQVDEVQPDAITLTLAKAEGEAVGTGELMRFVAGPDLPTGGVLIEAPEVISSSRRPDTTSTRSGWIGHIAYGRSSWSGSNSPYPFPQRRAQCVRVSRN